MISEGIPRFPAGSPIEDLADQFRTGSAPTADSLVGEWKATRRVTTEKFVTGRGGPDRVFQNSGSVAFRRDGNKGLEVLYSGIRRWASPEHNADGDIVFEADDAADVAILWSCRLSKTSRLICFDLAHIGGGVGDAIEFARKDSSRKPSGGRR